MYTKKDLTHINNLKRLLAKAKLELEGEEILAAADVLVWVASLSVKIEENIKSQEIPALIPAVPQKIEVPEQKQLFKKRSKKIAQE